MGITVTGHHHDTPLVLRELGASGQSLVIQTGSLMFNLTSSSDGPHFSYPVIDLPSLGIAHATDLVVQATATCAPASFQLWPHIQLPVRLKAEVVVRGSGTVTNGGFVSITGTGTGPVVTESGESNILGGSSDGAWHVGMATATRNGNTIDLEGDVYVNDEAILYRIAYTVFVVLSKPLTSGYAHTVIP